METILLFAPLLGALICGFGWPLIGEKAAQWTATGLLFFSAFLSWITFFTFDGHTEQITIFRWIESGTPSVRAPAGVRTVPVMRPSGMDRSTRASSARGTSTIASTPTRPALALIEYAPGRSTTSS